MRFEWIPYDKNHYATNLQRSFDQKTLKWDASPSQDVLLVRGPYGEGLDRVRERIAESMSALSEVPVGKFVHLFGHYYARYVSAKEYATNGGAEMEGGGVRYSVIACHLLKEEDRAILYESNVQVMIKNYLDLSMKCTIQIGRYTYRKGLFKKRVETEFYEVSVDDSVLATYESGDIYYTLRNIDVPVTREMITARTFYVKSEVLPAFTSRNRGIEVVIAET